MGDDLLVLGYPYALDDDARGTHDADFTKILARDKMPTNFVDRIASWSYR